MKIGIMGGKFDPIHNGHLMLGDTARDQFGLDVIWFMPNGRPPHKALDSIGSDTDMRAKMVALAIKDHKSFELQDYELKRKEVSYSYETLEYFHAVYPEDEFYFIIGADSLRDIEKWVHPERLLAVCHVLAISSHELRAKIRAGESITGLVPAEVEAFIAKEGLYES